MVGEGGVPFTALPPRSHSAGSGQAFACAFPKAMADKSLRITGCLAQDRLLPPRFFPLPTATAGGHAESCPPYKRRFVGQELRLLPLACPAITAGSAGRPARGG